MNKKISLAILVLVLIIGAFYGGTVYAKSKVPARGQFAGGQFAASGARSAGGRGAMNGGFTTGEIIAKDATSVTVKIQDTSTKIALIASSTQIMKTSPGSLNDLIIGTNVVITGAANSDGSITAQSVQIRPAGSAPIGGMRAGQ